MDHISNLASYDMSWDVRDTVPGSAFRARDSLIVPCEAFEARAMKSMKEAAKVRKLGSCVWTI